MNWVFMLFLTFLFFFTIINSWDLIISAIQPIVFIFLILKLSFFWSPFKCSCSPGRVPSLICFFPPSILIFLADLSLSYNYSQHFNYSLITLSYLNLPDTRLIFPFTHLAGSPKVYVMHDSRVLNKVYLSSLFFFLYSQLAFPCSLLFEPETRKSFLILFSHTHRYSPGLLSEIFQYPSLSSALHCVYFSDHAELLPTQLGQAPQENANYLLPLPTPGHFILQLELASWK